jgi:hypothetical protein
MSGRGNNNRGGGHQGQGRGRHGKGRGNGPKPKIGGGSNKKGAEEKLGDHIFTYGTRDAADQMRQTWKYITTYVGNAYSGDVMMELHDRKTYVIPPPEHSKAVKDAHEEAVKKYKARIERELQNHRDGLAVVLKASTDQSSSITMAIIAT